jgi:type I restriction enzyme S subunit
VTTKGWNQELFTNIAHITSGNAAPQGEEYFDGGETNFVRVKDLGRLKGSVYVRETADKVNALASQSLRIFPKGSVLFTKSGASLLLNQRAILAENMHVVSHIGIAVPTKKVISEWLYYWLTTVDFTKYSHGANMPSLPLAKVKKIEIPVPQITQQKQIVEEIEKQFSRLDKTIADLKRVKANLKRYKASVLQAAVTGKLTEAWRKQNPDVEPASKLLERILIERRQKWEAAELAKLTAKGLPAPKDGVWWLYVILCDDDSFYIGVTSDMPRRWSEHTSGKGAEWTKKHKPVLIIHHEKFCSQDEAYNREKELKTGFGRKWLKREYINGRLRQAGKTPKNDKWKEKYKEPAAPDTSNLPELPDGWVWATLPQLGELNRGKSKHRPRNDPKLYGGDYPFIQTGDVKHAIGIVNKYTQTYSEEGLKQSRLWPEGTLCITIAANIADTAILGFDACFPDSIIGFIPEGNAIDTCFAEYFIRTAKENLDRFAPATAQKNINLGILSAVGVPLPTRKEQQVIIQEIESRLSVAEELERMVEANLKRAELLRQSILKQAFSGKLV